MCVDEVVVDLFCEPEAPMPTTPPATVVTPLAGALLWHEILATLAAAMDGVQRKRALPKRRGRLHRV